MFSDELDQRRAAIDPDRLLPGEHPGEAAPGEAGRWVDVYSELVATKRQLLATLLDLMAASSTTAREELERADVRMLELQIERFETRLRLWQAKLAETSERDPGHPSTQ